jgi:uncharacterized protein (DUF433 family)
MAEPTRIVIQPDTCHGKPFIRGTRTPIAVILDHVAAGDSFESICANYDITVEDIRACVAFANDELKRTTFARSA